MSISITAWEYLFEKNFDEQSFEHRDSRLMDKQTKITISLTRKLYEKAKGNELPSEELGVVLLNDAGSIESILEYTSVLKEKGYVGINPSKFPNIMSATPLSRIAIEIGAKGPCVPLLSSKSTTHTLTYAFEQISAKRCRAMMFVHINKNNNCFGCFIEEELSHYKRNK
jgi:3-oxoacyl-(acyl-carrier-protein) synthase